MSESSADPGAEAWTCARCKVTTRWMPGHDCRRPATWIEDDGSLYCLMCQRALAAEAGAEGAVEGTTSERRAQLRAAALVDFEVRRDPDRTNGEIARAIRTSVPAVLKARRRLEAGSAR